MVRRACAATTSSRSRSTAPRAPRSPACATAGRRRAEATPRPVWNPDIDQPINFFEGWQQGPGRPGAFDNAFKVQWELFLRHVVDGEPFRWTLLEGAKGVQLAELGMESSQKRAWLDVGPLG